MRRLGRLPALVLVLTVAAIAAVTALETHADASRQAQLRVGALNLAVTDLTSAPYNADPTAGGPGAPAAARAEIRADERVVASGLSRVSGVEASSSSLATADADLASIRPVVEQVYRIAARPQGIAAENGIARLQQTLSVRTARLLGVLKTIDRTDADRAHTARLEAAIGTALAMLALVGVFLLFYVRSRRAQSMAEELMRENERLLGASRVEASTDALTGLSNRRALTDDLPVAIAAAETTPELLLAMFDLNGFKQYNDTFGHGAGDALLVRLGSRLATTVAPVGSAYRMGGDEFCLMARCTPPAAEGILAGAAGALADHGDGWSIDCSSGAVWIPSEASTPGDALLTADQRMYANKAMRSSASRQLTDVLLQVLSEQDNDLDAHVSHVAELAGRVAAALGQPAHEVRRVSLAAKLHDVGKTAIPGADPQQAGPAERGRVGVRAPAHARRRAHRAGRAGARPHRAACPLGPRAHRRRRVPGRAARRRDPARRSHHRRL